MHEAMQQAWEHALQGVVLFNQEMLTYLNPAAAQMLGVERERVTDKPLMLALRNHHLEHLSLAGGEATLEVRGKALHVKALPGLLLLWDRTEEQQRSEALEESSRMLAHEFRTPVAGMVSLIEAIQHGLPQAEQKEALDMLQQEVQRLARLVEDLPLHRSPQRERTFPIMELKPRLERFLALQQAQRSAWIRWETPHIISANPDAVYQVLLNLLENALRYGPGGEVVVMSKLIGEHLHLEVQDLGAPLESYDTLFQKGYRGIHAAHVQGSGLGLALVRRMAETWGGKAYAKRGEGFNAFGVTFPTGQENPTRSEYAGQF
jgi:signal transduction histidine kinase